VTTPQILALYIHAGLTLAVTLGPATLQLVLLFQPPTGVMQGSGEVRGGHVLGEDI
jgi:hypothetical protein